MTLTLKKEKDGFENRFHVFSLPFSGPEAGFYWRRAPKSDFYYIFFSLGRNEGKRCMRSINLPSLLFLSPSEESRLRLRRLPFCPFSLSSSLSLCERRWAADRIQTANLPPPPFSLTATTKKDNSGSEKSPLLFFVGGSAAERTNVRRKADGLGIIIAAESSWVRIHQILTIALTECAANFLTSNGA